MLMKLAFSPQIFEKRLDIKFHRNPSSGSRLVLCGPSDRHDGANGRFSHFYERPKNEVVTFTWPHYGTLYYHKPYNTCRHDLLRHCATPGCNDDIQSALMPLRW
jgi:hypothetical protein